MKFETADERMSPGGMLLTFIGPIFFKWLASEAARPASVFVKAQSLSMFWTFSRFDISFLLMFENYGYRAKMLPVVPRGQTKLFDAVAASSPPKDDFALLNLPNREPASTCTTLMMSVISDDSSVRQGCEPRDVSTGSFPDLLNCGEGAKSGQKRDADVQWLMRERVVRSKGIIVLPQ